MKGCDLKLERAGHRVLFSLGVMGTCYMPACSEDTGDESNQESSPMAPLVLDGEFSEWDDSKVGVNDPSGDSANDGLDFGLVQVANDADYLYLALDLGREVALNDEPSFTLYIDTDANPDTGIKVEDIGAELIWDLGSQDGEHWVGGERKSVKTRNLQFRVAPTVDARRFEIALSLSAEPSEGNPIFSEESIDIVVRDTSKSGGDRVPDSGSFRYRIDAKAATVERISFEPSTSTDIRVMSYNVERPGFDDDSVLDEFERIFQAINPDVILLQEQDNEALARTLIGQWLPPGGGDWYMDSMTDKVTLSRFPIDRSWPVSRGQLDQRILATQITLDDGRDFVLFNAHLSCCDDEISRQREADSFISFIREQQGGVDGALEGETPFVLAGDFNLVMKQQPLDTLMGGDVQYSAYGEPVLPDWDQSWLADALPRHSHQGMTYTWRSDYSIYWPGRLDFALYTDSVLKLEKSFVVDTESMDSESLQELRLEAQDTFAASDHRPLVFDFSVR